MLLGGGGRGIRQKSMYGLRVRKTDVSVFLDTTISFHVLIEYALDNSHLLSWSSGKTSSDLHGSHSGAFFNLSP